MGRLLALDIGSKRTGLAISDESQIISQPLSYTLNLNELAKGVAEICQEYQIEKIIVGLPKSLAGLEESQAEWVRQKTADLSKVVDCPIEYFDERLTTKQALRLESDAQTPIDCLAAQQMLEQYLGSSE